MNNFTKPWEPKITDSEWSNFLSETFDDKSRLYIYNELSKHSNFTLAEVGFGQCYDFSNYFKKRNDNGELLYTGYDVTNQFSEFANKTYSGYNFINKNFFKHPSTYDVIYTRHVLEHQHPDFLYTSFETVLKYSNKIAIVVWFKYPGIEEIQWIPTDGFDNSGAYVNTLDINKLNNLIASNGFNLKSTLVDKSMIYWMERL